MQNFSLLSQLLGPNTTACTKFGVTKCRIAPPLPPLSGGLNLSRGSKKVGFT